MSERGNPPYLSAACAEGPRRDRGARMGCARCLVACHRRAARDGQTAGRPQGGGDRRLEARPRASSWSRCPPLGSGCRRRASTSTPPSRSIASCSRRPRASRSGVPRSREVGLAARELGQEIGERLRGQRLAQRGDHGADVLERLVVGTPSRSATPPTNSSSLCTVPRRGRGTRASRSIARARSRCVPGRAGLVSFSNALRARSPRELGSTEPRRWPWAGRSGRRGARRRRARACARTARFSGPKTASNAAMRWCLPAPPCGAPWRGTQRRGTKETIEVAGSGSTGPCLLSLRLTAAAVSPASNAAAAAQMQQRRQEWCNSIQAAVSRGRVHDCSDGPRGQGQGSCCGGGAGMSGDRSRGCAWAR